MIQSGALRHRVDVEWDDSIQDANGSPDPHWIAFGTFYASVEPIRGNEALRANQLLSEMDTRIRMRWSPLTDQITTKHRILFAGNTYSIISIAHLRFERQELELMCKSGANDG